MSIEHTKEGITITEVNLMNGSILHIFTPTLHLSFTIDDSVTISLLDIFLGVRLR